MKIQNTTVNHRIYVTKGDDENSPVDLTLELTVEVERDPYCVGDSPTSYEVDFVSCDSSDGLEYDFSNIPNCYIEQIEDKAVSNIRGY